MVFDRWLFFTTALLALTGLIMVGSSSNYVAMEYGKSPSAFLVRHVIHLALSFVVLWAALKIPYQRLSSRWLVLGAVAGCAVALLAVLAMPASGGAQRWIALGPLRLQPSEFTKLGVVLFLAYMLSKKEDRINEPATVLVPSLAVVGVLSALVLVEPDLGTVMMLAAVSFVMLFSAGLRWRYVGAAAALGIVVLAVGVALKPYRLERIKTFLDPSVDKLGASFQLNQSLIAVGSGGLTGTGLGQGRGKAFYIPAAHTDFIYSVIGEELGMLGTVGLLLAFLVVFWRGMRAATRAPDRFGFYLALGMTSLIVFQALINMGVCVGLLPTKGLPLPFISYGGSSLLASMAAIGLVLNVSLHSN
jgi:cell division protein FtsW